MWVCFLFGGFMCFFFWEYHKSSLPIEAQQRRIQSLHSFSVSPFLVRIQSNSGFTVAKVKVQFFVDGIEVQNELREESDQYKEHLIFFLSKAESSDFLDKKSKEDLVEKIKNQINSFLSKGKIQEVVIESQFMDEGGFDG